MRLLDYKARHGLSVTKLAAQLGFGVSTVHGWLTDRREPSPPAVLAIVRATGGAVRAADLRRDLADVARLERRAQPKEVA
jgi:DNA-binding transcriptional regulator YdaS (Cro superfamily)